MKTISPRSDRRPSASCRTAPPSTISRHGPTEQTKNPLDVAIDGGGFLAVQTPAGERYTRDGGLQINNQGQLVTASGYQVLGNSGPIVFQPTDKQINIASDGNVTVLEGTSRIDSVRGKLRLVTFAQAQQLVKEGSNLYAAGEGQAAQPDTTSRLRQGFIEKSNVNSVHEMSRMIEITRDLHADLVAAAAAERFAQIGDRKTRRRSGLRGILTHARTLHRSDRNGGTGTQRSGDLQQHREHAHHRLQEAARGVPGPDL